MLRASESSQNAKRPAPWEPAAPFADRRAYFGCGVPVASSFWSTLCRRLYPK